VSEQGRIFDMSGKQLALVGGKGFSALGPDLDSWLVQGTEWAIKGEGNTLVTVDVRHPRVTSTYDLSDLLAQPRPPKDSDFGILDVLAVAGTAKRLIIVTGENPVTIGVLDRATRKLVKIEPPRCPPRFARRVPSQPPGNARHPRGSSLLVAHHVITSRASTATDVALP
jgi:hypothetical protein